MKEIMDQIEQTIEKYAMLKNAAEYDLNQKRQELYRDTISLSEWVSTKQTIARKTAEISTFNTIIDDLKQIAWSFE